MPACPCLPTAVSLLIYVVVLCSDFDLFDFFAWCKDHGEWATCTVNELVNKFRFHDSSNISKMEGRNSAMSHANGRFKSLNAEYT